MAEAMGFEHLCHVQKNPLKSVAWKKKGVNTFVHTVVVVVHLPNISLEV
jgi:hypothetical protein